MKGNNNNDGLLEDDKKENVLKHNINPIESKSFTNDNTLLNTQKSEVDPNIFNPQKNEIHMNNNLIQNNHFEKNNINKTQNVTNTKDSIDGKVLESKNNGNKEYNKENANNLNLNEKIENNFFEMEINMINNSNDENNENINFQNINLGNNLNTNRNQINEIIDESFNKHLHTFKNLWLEYARIKIDTIMRNNMYELLELKKKLAIYESIEIKNSDINLNNNLSYTDIHRLLYEFINSVLNVYNKEKKTNKNNKNNIDKNLNINNKSNNNNNKFDKNKNNDDKKTKENNNEKNIEKNKNNDDKQNKENNNEKTSKENIQDGNNNTIINNNNNLEYNINKNDIIKFINTIIILIWNDFLKFINIYQLKEFNYKNIKKYKCINTELKKKENKIKYKKFIFKQNDLDNILNKIKKYEEEINKENKNKKDKTVKKEEENDIIDLDEEEKEENDNMYKYNRNITNLEILNINNQNLKIKTIKGYDDNTNLNKNQIDYLNMLKGTYSNIYKSKFNFKYILLYEETVIKEYLKEKNFPICYSKNTCSKDIDIKNHFIIYPYIPNNNPDKKYLNLLILINNEIICHVAQMYPRHFKNFRYINNYKKYINGNDIFIEELNKGNLELFFIINKNKVIKQRADEIIICNICKNIMSCESLTTHVNKIHNKEEIFEETNNLIKKRKELEKITIINENFNEIHGNINGDNSKFNNYIKKYDKLTDKLNESIKLMKKNHEFTYNINSNSVELYDFINDIYEKFPEETVDLFTTKKIHSIFYKYISTMTSFVEYCNKDNKKLFNEETHSLLYVNNRKCFAIFINKCILNKSDNNLKENEDIIDNTTQNNIYNTNPDKNSYNNRTDNKYKNIKKNKKLIKSKFIGNKIIKNVNYENYDISIEDDIKKSFEDECNNLNNTNTKYQINNNKKIKLDNIDTKGNNSDSKDYINIDFNENNNLNSKDVDNKSKENFSVYSDDEELENKDNNEESKNLDKDNELINTREEEKENNNKRILSNEKDNINNTKNN